MAEDFLLKIRGGYNQFTKAEKKVADYILGSPQESSVHVHHGAG